MNKNTVDGTSLCPYSEVRDSLVAKKITSTEILTKCLDNSEKFAHLNAFARIYTEEAKEVAKSLDQQNTHQKSLHGMVVGIKDLYNYKNHPLQAGSKILENYISTYNSTVVDRLIDNGAIILGHQNCDEFAMGSSNETSIYGPCINMLGENLVSGGSSGGSAVAVQAKMCHVSIGTDTGGSVRQPAALCGVVGLKPTYSRISRYGVVAYASSLDTVSIFSQNVKDCATTLEILAGEDQHDATCSKKPVEKYSDLRVSDKKFKIAYIKESLQFKGLNEEVKLATESKIDFLKENGHEISEVSFDLLEYALPTYYIIANAEAASNLSCYDAIKYGYSTKNFSDYKDLCRKSRTEAFGDEVKRRIIVGNYVLSSGSYAGWYTKAQKVRRLIAEKMYSLLKEYDFLIMPTTPNTAFKIGAIKDPITMYLEDYYTVPFSIAGVPTISLPNGLDSQGLPIGIQIAAAPFMEKKLLELAYNIENKS